MPLKIGHSRSIISDNISELVHAGYGQKQAIAISMNKAGKSKKKKKESKNYDKEVINLAMKKHAKA